MGPLAGFKYKEVVRKLRNAGFVFDRNAKGSHEIWWSLNTRKRTTIPNHPGDIPECTLRAILKQADIPVEEFLKS
jgi:predicted RNA binding protein YcfA (HicA-like mRNA interferase family)